MLDSLLKHRKALTAITDRMAPHLSCCTPDGASELVRCRREITGVLTDLQVFVHREIFLPLSIDDDATERRRGVHLKAECVALAEDVRQFARRWTDVDLAAHWAEYLAVAEGFRRQVAERLDTMIALESRKVRQAA